MDWEKGFFEVDLSQIKRPDLDPNWQNSHGYSRQQMDAWVRQLGEVQRLSVERGYTYEDFQRMRGSQVPAERELGETHHKFYDHGHQTGNHDFVSLAWDGKEYQVNNNGRHRVSSAQDMGLRRVPAEISARSEHMEKCKRDGYASSLMHPSDRADFSRSRDQNLQQPSKNTTAPSDQSRSISEPAQIARSHPERTGR